MSVSRIDESHSHIPNHQRYQETKKGEYVLVVTVIAGGLLLAALSFTANTFSLFEYWPWRLFFGWLGLSFLCLLCWANTRPDRSFLFILNQPKPPKKEV